MTYKLSYDDDDDYSDEDNDDYSDDDDDSWNIEPYANHFTFFKRRKKVVVDH
jgi:hypothetical protein